MATWSELLRRLTTDLARFAIPITLLGLLAYSQWGWRRADSARARTTSQLIEVEIERTFPQDGDQLLDAPLAVRTQAATRSLASVAQSAHARVLLFSRAGCAPCDWLAAQMDSMKAPWQDSTLVVAPFGRRAHRPGFLELDSLSSQALPGVPSVLVLSPDGRIEHSAVGLKRLVTILEMSGRHSPARKMLSVYQDSMRARR